MDIVKSIFNPAKQATAASGSLGGLAGQQGGRFGHLGEKYGFLGADQIAFKPEDHFDISAHFDFKNHFDPEKLVKRY